MGRTRTMVWSVCLAAVLLSGCSPAAFNKNASEEPAVVIETKEPEAQAVKPAGDLQSGQERQLVMIFIGLIRMDRQSGLAITGTQAEAMLPLIRKSKDEGSLNEAELGQVTKVLTDAQRSYLDDQSRQMKNRSQQSSGRSTGELSPAEVEKRIEAFRKRRTELAEQSGSSGKGAGSNAGESGKGMGKSVEQQLIELLESKLSPPSGSPTLPGPSNPSSQPF